MDLETTITQLRELLQILQAQFEASGTSRIDPEFRVKLHGLHDADIAAFFESLEPELRVIAWQQLDADILAAVINDMDEPAAKAMVRELPNAVLAKGLKQADDVEDVEGVLRCLTPKRRTELMQLADLDNNVQLLKSLSFAADTVGEYMDLAYLALSPHFTVKQTQEKLREFTDLPSHTDKLFIIDAGKLVGVLPLKRLLLNKEETLLSTIMVTKHLHTLSPETDINEAIDIFERYDLVSAPVLNQVREVIGRVTIDEIMHHLQGGRHAELLSSSGLKEEEDLYAPIKTRLQNRGFWVFINLIAAFLVSRMIGTFESVIVQVVALASLMPIIASMAGNTGMQTATLVIRALTLNQIDRRNWYYLLNRELLLGGVNGLLWGALVGLFGLLFYQDIALATVLTVSMALVFLLGALAGFMVPLVVKLLGKDPALGTAVIVTTLTDCFGFFIFLGLGSKYLVN